MSSRVLYSKLCYRINPTRILMPKTGFIPYLVLFQRIFLSPKFAFFIDCETVLDISIFKGVRITGVSPAFSRGL